MWAFLPTFGMAKWLAGVFLALSLGACTSDGAGKKMPDPRFGQDPATNSFVAGKAALARGDAAEAIRQYEAGLALWPINKAAWTGLADAYAKEVRAKDVEYAVFFRDRMDWIASQNPHTVTMAFHLFSNRESNSQASKNPRIRAMAQKVADFFRQRMSPDPKTFTK